MNSNIQSITAKLVSLSKKKQVPYDQILTHFILERIVARLVIEPKLEKHLVFKGGFVSVRGGLGNQFFNL